MFRSKISFLFSFLNALCIKVFLSENLEIKQPIYFKENQQKDFIIDSFLTSSNQLSDKTDVIIDCLVESSRPFKQKFDIKWMRDTLDQNQYSFDTSVFETSKEVLKNGSLKLSYETRVLENQVPKNQMFFQISSFRCLAGDSFGKILSRPSRIFRFVTDRGDDSNKFLRQPQNTSINVGNRLLLRCKPNLTSHLKIMNEKSLNLIQYEWFKDNNLIVLKPETNVYKDGSLEIIAVEMPDSGWYHCEARFRLAKFQSKRAYIEVKQVNGNSRANQIGIKPRFKHWPEDRVVQEEGDAGFECLAENDPTHGLNSSFTYIWLKDGLALDPNFNKHVQIIQGISLRIEKVLESDSGGYTCRICSNHPLDNECDERTGYLKVLVAPRFVKKPSNLNVTLKSDAEFECSAYGVPHPSIQWYKNGEPIYPSEYFQFNSNQGNLKILGIIAQDEGYYQCVASNDLDTIQSVAQLIVHSDDYQINYDYDSTIHKTTHSIFNPYPTTTNAIIHLSSPLSLKTNRIDSKSIGIEWKQPVIIRGIDKLTYSVNWRAKGTNRLREINTTETNCIIDDLKPNTIYLISVKAFAMATYSPSVEIEAKTDQHLSNAPIDFKAELIDYYTTDGVLSFSPTLRFKWKKPNSNRLLKYRLYYQHLHYGPVTNSDLNPNEFKPSVMDQYDEILDDGFNDDFYYEIRNQEEEKSSEKYINIDIPADFVNSDHYEFLLEDLLKYSTYKFRLVAIDMNYFDKIRGTNLENSFIPSESEPFDEYIDESYLKENSAAILVETPSDVPDGAPENVQTETVNTTSVLLKWEMPALDKRNGPIIGYKIAVKENEKQMWHLDVDSEPRFRVMSGFLSARKYSFRVTAKTVNGSGPASDWVFAETFAHEMDESRVPGQPAAIHTEPTDKSIVIQWAPPLDSNYTLVRKYLLTYGIGYPKIEIEIDGKKNSFILDNLVPSSQYVVSLRAGNNAGYGMEILKDVFTKRKSFIDQNESLFPPLNVQAVAISSRAIEVRWTDWHLRPDEAIVDDRVYTIRYRIVAEMANSKFIYKNSTERNVIINDLVANTLYDFAVRLNVNGKESPWSMTTSQMTMEASPAPSEINIVPDPNNPENVIITWKAPNLLHNSGYIIYYLDEENFKENKRWNNEIINSFQSGNKIMKHTIKNLKAETIYYFKIQARNSRAYGTSSATVLFRTPDSNGVGGGQIVTSSETGSEPTVVLNKNENSPLSKVQLEISFIWVITACISALFLIVVILVAVLVCKKTQPKSKESNFNRNNLTSSTRPFKNRSERNEEFDDEESYQKNALLQQQQQQQQILNTMSNTSTLLRQKTPHHQPLLINNPNHMMMNVMNPLSLSNTHNSDMEFYGNSQPGMFTGNSHANSESSCFNSEQHYQIQNSNLMQMNNFSSRHGDQYTDEQTNSAIQAANAAFNSPFNPNFIPTVNLSQNNEPMFLRQTVKPKPIALPINSGSNSVQSPLDQQSVFSTNNPARKSYKNLPMATATLISNQTINFNNSNSQKIHYTAKPYIIDNQVQVSGEYTAHSPASSSHSGCPSQVYDKIGNINTSASSSKSLLQPLKSFSNSNATSNHVHSSSMSIPSTPSKHSDAKEFKSPAKKQLLVSLSSNSNNTSTSVTKAASNILINGKSSENVYEKKFERTDEGMTQEMANLEGIMKDLNAITAKQFEC